MSATRKHFYPGVNALRGCAALLVVIQHAGFFAAEATKTAYGVLLRVAFGSLGVLVFFAISGFVIGLSRHLPAGEFALRRIIRIYPAFWVAYALSALIMSSVGRETGFSWSVLFLLPNRSDVALYLPVWSLVFEVFFYAVFTVALLFRPSDRTLTTLALAWIVMIHLMQDYIIGGAFANPGFLIPFAQYNQFFAVGLICAIHIEAVQRLGAQVLLGIAIVALAVLPLFPAMPHAAPTLVYAIAASAIMMATTFTERVPNWLNRLGDASYGVFLTHMSVIACASTMLTAWPYSAYSLWPLLFLLGLAASFPFGMAEFIFQRRIRKLILQLGAARLRSSALP